MRSVNVVDCTVNLLPFVIIMRPRGFITSGKRLLSLAYHFISTLYTSLSPAIAAAPFLFLSCSAK